jgi:pyrophosphate--fructose-6-phosphate 1-phosphotransferase
MPENKPVKTVAMLTAGGLAPCLSSAVGGLIERYTEVAPDVRIIAYLNGYAGLLKGESREVTPEVRANAHRLHAFGGTPIGNSRVKLTNVKDCVKRGLVREGQDPLHVAAEQLSRDRIDVLHTIGGDDTNGTAADLAAYLRGNGYALTVVGLPKTIDNDVIPIAQSLGAWTAAEQGALFARNIVAEHSTNPRMLIVHEVMGRNCGWLTAATALAHHQWVKRAPFAEWLDNKAIRWDVHGVFVPERPFDIAEEARRLRRIMDEEDCVNLFISEGAGVSEIVAAMEAAGDKIPRDAFGHVHLDKINPGQWFASRFAAELGADKVLVQKSGYFSRSAAANAADLALIRQCTDYAIDAALRGESGVVGQDEERGGALRAIEFERIAGGKKFDTSAPWFTELLRDIGQA